MSNLACLFKELLMVIQKILNPLAILPPCSNIQLRLPRMRGLSASMVVSASFFQ